MNIINDITAETRKLTTDRNTLMKFALLWFVVFGLTSFIMFRRSHNGYYFAACSTFSLCAAFWFPQSLKRIYLAWMMLSFLIGWFMTRFFLSVIYYVLISPMGVFLRMAGKDLLDERPDPGAGTYWKKHDTSDDPKRYERQF